jgi:hypothetical protein
MDEVSQGFCNNKEKRILPSGEHELGVEKSDEAMGIEIDS